MRKILFYISAAVTILACSKHEAAQTTAAMEEQLLSVNIGTPTVRTAIDGASSEKTLRVWWSNGDVININGQKSSEFTGSGQETSAEFKINNVQAPYRMVYPHSAYKGENEDGTVTVTFPAVQKYTPNSFESGAMIMYGYSETESIDCRYACGAIKIGLKANESEIVKSILIHSMDEDCRISGDFTIDPSDDTITAGENGGRTITVEFPENGLTLSESSTYIIATIPAGSYPGGFEIKMLDMKKRVMRRLWLKQSADGENGVEIFPGRITSFDNQEFITDSREICSAEDWEDFAAACNGNQQGWEDLWISKNGSVVVGNDFTTEKLTKIETLPADIIIDGKGHVITQTHAEGPLFGSVEGTVKNLSLDGRLEAMNPYEDGTAAFCRVLQNGVLDGCTNLMDISVNQEKTSLYIAASALVRSFHGGTIRNCTNKGKLNITTSQEKTSKVTMAGGLVAIVKDLAACALITDCTNEGEVVVTLDKADDGASAAISHGGFGGIVGVVKAGDATDFLTISNCRNLADVTVRNATDPTKTNHGKNIIGTGGIVGLCAPLNSDGASIPSSLDGWYMSLEKCCNKGNISNGLISFTATNEITKICSGGIAGVIIGSSTNPASISECDSDGTVHSYEGTGYIRAAFMNVAGGLCGMGAFLNADKCSTAGQVGSLKRQHFSVSSGIGLALGTFNLNGCSFGCDLSLIRVKRYSELNWSLAFTTPVSSSCVAIKADFIKLAGSSIKNCIFKGQLTTNKSVLSDALNASGAYKTSGYGDMQTIGITSDDFQTAIASDSYDGTAVAYENNAFWEEIQ